MTVADRFIAVIEALHETQPALAERVLVALERRSGVPGIPSQQPISEAEFNAEMASIVAELSAGVACGVS